MKIYSYKDPEFKTKLHSSPYKVLVNPSSVSHTFSLSFDDDKLPAGAAHPATRWKKTKPETMSFDLIFDGTGVIDSKKTDVDKMIKEFKKYTLKYQGDIHEPAYLKLSWGTVDFKCRLSSLNITYTLFKADGKALRAKAEVSFISFTSSKEETKRKNSNSPDLSHVRTVLKGDTLPIMCKRIYNDPSLYLEIARINGLVNFRRLEPGSQLLFPPLKEGGG